MPTNVFRSFRALPFALLLIFATALPVIAGPFEDAVAKFANDEFSDTEEAVDTLATSSNPLAYSIVSALQDDRLMADPDKVIDAIVGVKVPNLSGGTSEMLPNHHITKPVFIGEVRADGQFDVVWKTPGLVPGDAWSKYLPESKDLIGDWKDKKCGNYNTVTKKCGSGA